MTARIRTRDDILQLEREMPFEARMPEKSVHDLFVSAARKFGDRRALTMIITGDEAETPRVMSYRELLGGVTRAANLFASIGGPGVGVAFLLPILIETQLVLWGAETAGYAVPINFLLQAEQVAALVRASGAKILVALGPHPEIDLWSKALRVAELVAGVTVVAVGPPDQSLGGAVSFAEGLSRQPGDALTFGEARGGEAIAAYFHTGGTTGAPKLVAHTHHGQITTAFGAATLLALDERDVLTHGLPMFHVGGALACSLASVVAGTHDLLMSPAGLRNPLMIRRFWRIVERYRATIVIGVPTSIAAVCEVPIDGDLSSVRLGVTGAAATPRAVAERFEACTGKPLHEVLGMTEVSGVLAVDPAAGERTLGSVGFPIPYTEVSVRRLGLDGALGDACAAGEVGVLTVRGAHVSPGYRDGSQGAAWLEGGWLDGGDLAYRDEAGKIFIAGRSKDLIIRGGHNIDPAMIEEAFTAHPAVALAAAVGEPDVHAGEIPVCYVALRAGAVVAEDELRAFVEARIAERPAWPRQIRIVDALPLTAVGKIYKPALRVDATCRAASAAVSLVLGHARAEVTAVPGGKRGMTVRVLVGKDDAARREAVTAALAGYLFEAVVEAGDG